MKWLIPVALIEAVPRFSISLIRWLMKDCCLLDFREGSFKVLRSLQFLDIFLEEKCFLWRRSVVDRHSIYFKSFPLTLIRGGAPTLYYTPFLFRDVVRDLCFGDLRLLFAKSSWRKRLPRGLLQLVSFMLVFTLKSLLGDF